MPFCLLKPLADKFLQRLKQEGSPEKLELFIERLQKMSSEARRDFLSGIVGVEDAPKVNALIEEKLMLKNWKSGVLTAIDKMTGLKPEVKKGMIEKVNGLKELLKPGEEHAFLEDLAAKKLKLDVVTEADAKKVFELSEVAKQKREVLLAKQKEFFKDFVDKQGNITDMKGFRKAEKEFNKVTPERMEYGYAFVAFKDYLNKLHANATDLTFKEAIKLENWGRNLTNLMGASKAMLASLDNSFFGRQGIKVLFTHPLVWMDAFKKSWGDMGRELKGTNAMAPIQAEIYSRYNAVNGIYEKMGLDIGIGTEEAFPSALPEKIPGFKRLYKASESAFNGAALRMRADLADKYLTIAFDQGIDITNKPQLSSIGKMVNSLTGRGNLGQWESIGSTLNVAMFSPKFLKANLDILTAHQFQKDVTPFVRKQAAKNLFKIVAVVATINAVSQMLDDKSVEWNPLGTNLGKIKKGKFTIDMTGGMGSIAVLGARLAAAFKSSMTGEKGFKIKNAQGKWTSVNTGAYGGTSGMDLLWNFAEGKASPSLGVLMSLLRGEGFAGQKLTPGYVAQSLGMPLPAQNVMNLLQSKDSSGLLILMIMDGLGFTTNFPKK